MHNNFYLDTYRYNNEKIWIYLKKFSRKTNYSLSFPFIWESSIEKISCVCWTHDNDDLLLKDLGVECYTPLENIFNEILILKSFYDNTFFINHKQNFFFYYFYLWNNVFI